MKLSHTTVFAVLTLALTIFCTSSRAQTDQPKNDANTILKISRSLSKLVNASPKPDVAEPSDAVSKVKEAPVPATAGVVIRTPSLEVLDKGADEFFQQTSGTGFSILSALQLTDYRRALSTFDTQSEVGIAVFFEAPTPQIAVILPVNEKKFGAFINGLAQTVPPSERNATLDADGKTANITLKITEPIAIVARQISPDYIALVQAQDVNLLSEFAETMTERMGAFLPPSLVEPTLTIEATDRALTQLTKEDRPFWNSLTQALSPIEKTLSNAQVGANLTEIREYVRRNLASLRCDILIDGFGVYVSTQTLPRQNSAGEKNLKSYAGLSQLNPDADRFFVTLPDVESPLGGQNEISSELAKTLPKPFNRLKFVEYSLNLPLSTELAAESWQFFLEVDDSDEFVKEMIIPKARVIGGYVGSKEVANIGEQLFGAIAERRLDRQANRRRAPRRAANPEQAAALGAAIGGALGGKIGADSGEKSAMTPYKFDDFTMYVSDLETYTRQKSLMKAEEAGQILGNQGSSLLFNRDRPLLSALDMLMANVENGDGLQNSILRSANEKAEQIDNSPLFVRKSNIVVLDKNHILLGLGNQELLRLAVNNWKSLTRNTVRYQSLVKDVDGIYNLQSLCAHLPNLPNERLTSAIRLDLATGIAYYNWLTDHYLPTAPKLDGLHFPADMPKALAVSCVNSEQTTQTIRIVAQHKTISDIFSAVTGGSTPLQLLMSKKKSNQGKIDAGTDIDDIFDN